jgi:hypothetical protein
MFVKSDTVLINVNLKNGAVETTGTGFNNMYRLLRDL